MHSQILCRELEVDEWSRLRDLRLASLTESSAAFGGNLEVESNFDESQWREQFKKLTFLIAIVDNKDVAILSIEVLNGDFGATCWIGGCWSDPEYRGKGTMRAMLNYIDSHAEKRNWSIQGLGVWLDNYSAIAAYEKLGFVTMGEPKKSTRVLGKFYQTMIRQAPRIEGN